MSRRKSSPAPLARSTGADPRPLVRADGRLASLALAAVVVLGSGVLAGCSSPEVTTTKDRASASGTGALSAVPAKANIDPSPDPTHLAGEPAPPSLPSAAAPSTSASAVAAGSPGPSASSAQRAPASIPTLKPVSNPPPLGGAPPQSHRSSHDPI
ncbi:MAG: hypothetical protein U0414_36945 [Polyangiaceae bacterium]